MTAQCGQCVHIKTLNRFIGFDLIQLKVLRATRVLMGIKEIYDLTEGGYWHPGIPITPEARKGEGLWTDHVSPGVRRLIFLRQFAASAAVKKST